MNMADNENDGFVLMYKNNGKVHYIIASEETNSLIGTLLTSTFQNKINLSPATANIKDGIIEKMTTEKLFKKEDK